VPYRDRHGYRRVADLSDLMEAQGFTGVEALSATVVGVAQQGDWVIDVGANVGLVSLPLCARVGPAGTVWAIEPLPRNVDRLIAIKTQNGLSQLHVIPAALGAADGQGALHVPTSRGSGWASLVKEAHSDIALTVPVRALDSLVAEAHVPGRLRLIKIDVEGFEPQVLEGARETILGLRPYIQCEFHDGLLREGGSTARRLLEQFATLGYRPAVPPRPLEARGQDILMVPS
jgi:FkbM family methyltransferase